jgi:hypothetical protein
LFDTPPYNPPFIKSGSLISGSLTDISPGSLLKPFEEAALSFSLFLIFFFSLGLDSSSENIFLESSALIDWSLSGEMSIKKKEKLILLINKFCS